MDRALRRIRRRMRPVRFMPGDEPSVVVLQDVKLFRDVRIGGTTYRGSGDAVSRPVDYIFDALPEDALKGKVVLDLGSAGGAMCFGAVERGCAQAVGVEIAEIRLRGAEALKRIAGVENVRFVRGDFFAFLRGRTREFDIVFALNVLHHLGNPFPLLRRICRASNDYFVLETPHDVDVAHYSEYSADLLRVEGARAARSPQDFVKFLAVYDFAVQRHEPSLSEVEFFRGDQSARSVYVFKRELRLKSRKERGDELEDYRHERMAAFRRARSSAFNIDLRPGDALIDVLSARLGSTWTAANANFLIAGPRGSGKTHLYEQLGASFHPSYDPKIFKFPNAAGRQGLRQHLGPRRGQGRKFAQVLISTADDEHPHCTKEQLATALRAGSAICLLLNPDFDEHLRRLYNREAERFGRTDSDVDYDVSLRYDSSRFVDEFEKRGIPYRVLTIAGASEP
jgi:hypothetical protein